MKGKYKRVTVYCHSCDMSYVVIGKKCKACGVKLLGVKLKKPSKDKLLKEIENETED